MTNKTLFKKKKKSRKSKQTIHYQISKSTNIHKYIHI